MSLKHLYNSTEGLVLKSLRGTVALNPSLRLDNASKTVYLHSNNTQKRVAVVSGGGAGHEPAHAGYTGHGMLTACVIGDIFASPSAKQVLAAIKLAAFHATAESHPRDIVIIINNYTGDRLNFGFAIEKARLAFPRLKIESVLVADDISLLHQTSTSLVGPRGLAGNILICKLLGALAEQGASVETIKTVGDAVASNLKSVGMGLDPCHIPGHSSEGTTRLGSTEYELGLGLHNEAGVAKYKIDEVDKILDRMVNMVLDAVPEQMSEVVLFINNLGGISQLEMGAVVHDIVALLETKGVGRPQRIYCSYFMTSLNAPGFSVSLLDITRIHLQTDVSVYELLDATTTALSWVNVNMWGDHEFQTTEPVVADQEKGTATVGRHVIGRRPRHALASGKVIRGACLRVLEVENDLTQFDTIVGDGDCGTTFAAGANAILKALDNGDLEVEGGNLATLVHNVADILEDAMGGTIGALFGIFLNALSSALYEDVTSHATSSLKPSFNLEKAIAKSTAALRLYTPARVGDRTIMDALQPFCSVLQSKGGVVSPSTFAEAVKAARRGAESTRYMQARLGRAAYSSVKKSEMPPDPGAWGVCALLEGMLEGLGEGRLEKN